MTNTIVKGWDRVTNAPSDIRSTDHQLEVLATIAGGGGGATPIDVTVQVNDADASPTNPLPTGMLRSTVVRTVTIASGASLSNAFDMTGYAIVYIEIPATWTAANLGIVSAEALAGTYQAVGARDRYGTRDVISGIQTSELCLYEAPPAWAGAHYAKLISLNTGTGVAENQGGDRTLRVFLKS